MKSMGGPVVGGPQGVAGHALHGHHRGRSVGITWALRGKAWGAPLWGQGASQGLQMPSLGDHVHGIARKAHQLPCACTLNCCEDGLWRWLCPCAPD